MAKPVRRRDGKRKPFKDETLPLSKENFVIIGLGLFVILGGYAAMLFEGSVEGFWPLVVAPILLVLGYCVIIPLGILFKKSYIRHESFSVKRAATGPGETQKAADSGKQIQGV